VFHYVDVMRQLYPAWSPDTGVFPFSISDSDGDFSSASRTVSYAASVDVGVRAMLVDDVSGDAGQVPDAAEWVGNTSAFLRIVCDAADRVYRLLTSELEGNSRRATSEMVGAVVTLFIVVALSPVVFVLIYRMTLTIQNYALGLSKKTKELS